MEVEQLDLELVLIWNAGIIGDSLAYCATMLALELRIWEGAGPA